MKHISIDRENLEKLYLIERLSIAKIAARLGCCGGTIWNYLHRFYIKPRLPWRLIDLSKEKLERLYIVEKLSTWAIEKKYGYRRGTVHRKLGECGIPIRNRADSHIRYPRKDFSNQPIEKSYVIGFAIGDLRVRKVYPGSKTIHIDCGSTHPAQIDLITELFQSYGHVWVGKPHGQGKVQIECAVNDSFSFLLEKRLVADSWIVDNTECFAAFFAGFTDAEGSIFIDNRGRAFYSLGNYNAVLLHQIREELIARKIECPAIHFSPKRIRPDGYPQNQDYGMLTISRKFHLLKLLDFIEPYVKHREKKEAIRRARKNIAARNKKFGYLGMES